MRDDPAHAFVAMIDELAGITLLWVSALDQGLC